MDEKALKTLNEIFKRGNSAEIKQRKDGIVIYEVKKKIVYEAANKTVFAKD